jgi:acyl-CoA synthetase (AMP-forming)/AMP-acid ligase II
MSELQPIAEIAPEPAAELAGGPAALHEAAATVRDVLHRRLDQEEPSLFPALSDAVRWTGEWLVARGVKASDVIALCAPDSIEFVALRRTATRVGGVLVRLSPLPPGPEMRFMSSQPGQPGRTRTRWLVTTSQMLVRRTDAAPRLPVLAESVLLGARETGRATAPPGQPASIPRQGSWP